MPAPDLPAPDLPAPDLPGRELIPLDGPPLEVTTIGAGPAAVVLLHGWQQDPAHLVELARSLPADGYRYLVPAAPELESAGGRTWWSMADGERPAWAWTDEEPAGYTPRPGVARAARAVRQLVAGETGVTVIGISQGAMLALHLGATAPEVSRVVAVSGVLLADSLAGLATPASDQTYLVVHGEDDEEIPFVAAERTREVLSARGRTVEWRPVAGGHTTTPEAVAVLRRFLDPAAPTPEPEPAPADPAVSG